MVNNTNDYPHAYNQIGYIRYAGQPGPTNENGYFTEYQDATGSSGAIFTDLGEDTSFWGGSSDTFSVYYDTGANLFKILLNNSQPRQTWEHEKVRFARNHIPSCDV